MGKNLRLRLIFCPYAIAVVFTNVRKYDSTRGENMCVRGMRRGIGERR